MNDDNPLADYLIGNFCKAVMEHLMNPGRELDALIAERVMGLKVETREPMYCHTCGKDFYSELDVQPYSTDIAAAWEVVERVNNLGKHSRDFLLRRSTYDSVNWEYFAWFRKDDADDGIEYSAFAASAPQAICLAALKAVGAL